MGYTHNSTLRPLLPVHLGHRLLAAGLDGFENLSLRSSAHQLSSTNSLKKQDKIFSQASPVHRFKPMKESSLT